MHSRAFATFFFFFLLRGMVLLADSDAKGSHNLSCYKHVVS